MKTLIKILIACIAILIGSCTPDPIEIDLPQAPQKLVIFSQILPDRFLLVTVSRSIGALDYQETSPFNQPIEEGDTLNLDSLQQANDSAQFNLLNQLLVDSCLVQVSYGGQTFTLQNIGNGTYLSAEILQNNLQLYELYVRDPASGLEVTAKTTMQPLVPITNLQMTKDTSNAFENMSAKLAFDDPEGRNFYMLNFVANVNNTTSFGLNGLRRGESFTKIFTDSELLGGEFDIETQFFMNNPDTVLVTLSNIDQAYFEFLAQYQKSQSEIPFLSEPVQYPSNVEGGYGYFNMYYPSIRLYTFN